MSAMSNVVKPASTYSCMASTTGMRGKRKAEESREKEESSTAKAMRGGA